MKLGIFGGAFDPFHNGHLAAARAAARRFRLDRLLLVPARRNPLKNRRLTAGRHRLAMIRLAIEGASRLAASDIELRRRGPSYTIDTVETFRRRNPDARLYLVVGTDLVPSLPRWKNISRLADAVTFIVVNRPGTANAKFPLDAEFRRLSVKLPRVSASEIRDRISRGLSVDNWVNPRVRTYIIFHHLYR
jgi:nicotinate-nucleotide adenylyltransferase